MQLDKLNFIMNCPWVVWILSMLLVFTCTVLVEMLLQYPNDFGLNYRTRQLELAAAFRNWCDCCSQFVLQNLDSTAHHTVVNFSYKKNHTGNSDDGTLFCNYLIYTGYPWFHHSILFGCAGCPWLIYNILDSFWMVLSPLSHCMVTFLLEDLDNLTAF